VAVKVVEYREEAPPVDGPPGAPGAPSPRPGQRDPDEDEEEEAGGHWADAQPRALLEGLLQERVDHPNVVRNYRFFTKPVPADDGLGCSDGDEDDERSLYGSSVGAPGGGSSSGGFAGGGGGGTASDGGAASDGGDAGGGGGGGGAVVPVRGGFAARALARPPSRPRPRMMEVWLVLEFCNRGCVADAAEKGWFRRRHSGFDPWPRAIVATAREVASAMAYLHDQVGGRRAGRLIGQGWGTWRTS
jgi:serine/threonine protein kinase